MTDPTLLLSPLASLLQEASSAEPWFPPERFGALAGAFGGGGLGILCGLFGAGLSWLGPRGRGRRLLSALLAFIALAGAAALVFGLAALVAGQPYPIWYPGLLIGVLALGGAFGMRPLLRRIYEQAEHRRLEAEALRSEQIL